MKSLYEQMGGTYREAGDYVLPNLILPEKEGVNEQLKAEKPMEWVRSMNNIHGRVTEVIGKEFIYT